MKTTSQPRRSLLAVTPAQSLLLATQAQAKKASALASLSNSDVDALLLAASTAAARFCKVASTDTGATLARERVAESITLRQQRRMLRLARRPATLFFATIDGVLVDSAELVVTAERILTWTPSASRCAFPSAASILVTYEAGYVTPLQKAQPTPPTGPDLPAEIERAVILIAQHFYGLQNRAQFDVAARVEEDSDVGRIETRYFSADRGGGIPADAAFLLAPYCELG